MSTKEHEVKLGKIIRYESIFFGMQEIFFNVETDIVNDNVKFIVECLELFGDS